MKTTKVVTLLAAIAAWMVGSPCGAQSAATGTVRGRIFNPVSKDYIRNAEVILTGTNQVTYSESDGSFQFSHVPAGQAIIVVTYTGYHSARDTFTVTPGQIASREINLTSTATAAATKGIVELRAFTVSAEREGNAKAIMEQRRNMDITTSVASDVFGEVANGNVGEFLKYLPGIDIDYSGTEPRSVMLGGMEGQYVGVSLDGTSMASSDYNRGLDESSRSVSFEGFSINSIESIEVSRTRSAESSADSPAGTINMKTRRAFDRKGRRIGFNASLNFNSEEFHLRKTFGPDERKHYQFKPNLSLEYSEAFLNQRLGILLSASRAGSHVEQYTEGITYDANATAADPRPLVITSLNFQDGPKFYLKDVLMLTADFKVTPRLVLSLNAIYSYSEIQVWNRNFSFIAANANTNVNNGRSRVGGDGVLTVRTQRSSTNTVPTLNNDTSSTSFNSLTYTRTFSPKFEYKLDAWTFDGALSFSRAFNNYEALERGFSEAEGLSFPSDWTATRSNPGSWEWTIRQTSGRDWYDLSNWSGGTRVSNVDRTWSTEKWNGQLNGRWVLPFLRRFAPAVKFGGQWNEETRDNNAESVWNAWRYIGPGGDVMTGRDATTGVPTITTSGNWANLGFVAPNPWNTGTTNDLTLFNIAGAQGAPPRADRNRIAELFQSKPELFVRTATPDIYYNAFIVNKRDLRQTVTAAYSQADVRATSKLQVRAGARWERTQNASTQWDPRLRQEVIAAGFPFNSSTGRATTFAGLQYQFQSQPRVSRRAQYDNVFPSVSAKYNLLRNFEFQAGYTSAIGRPPVGALAGLWNINETTRIVTAPNPDLLPEDIKKYDARLAYYFGGRAPGQISVGVTQADIMNLGETHDFTADEFGVDDPQFEGYLFRATRNSDRSRRQRSMEFSYNQAMGFLPELFRGTTFNLAYTRAYASARRNGLTPHRVTSRLGYAYRRFNSAVGMTWVDNRPDGNYGLFRPEETRFDLSLGWKLTARLSLYAQARLTPPAKWLRSPPGMAEGESPMMRLYYYYGTNWVFGCRGTF
jgi:iron complex outermembrane recepter protein